MSSIKPLNALKVLTIATRKSRLALWQAEHIADLLRQHYPQIEVRLLPMSTRGDEILDRSLAAIGGKGLFIKELERALQSGAADLAVHSLKDVPMSLDAEFELAAILPRESPFDAFVSNHYSDLDDLPKGAKVGTSSVRRQAVLNTFWPHLQVHSLRGNLDTRLSKLDAGEFDAIILAESGLRRLGYGARVKSVLSIEVFVPAVGQGALAIEISAARRDDLLPLLTPLSDFASEQVVAIERTIARTLAGSCQTPLGVYAQCLPSTHSSTANSFELSLRVQILGCQGEVLRISRQQDLCESHEIVASVLNELDAKDAKKLLAQWQAKAI